MPEMTLAEIHEEDTISRHDIHVEDITQVENIGKAFRDHVIKNDQQSRAVSKRDTKVFKQLKGIKESNDNILKTMGEWAPYITEGIKKSDAYKYVSNDLKKKGTRVKWWVGFVIIFFSLMGGIYSVIEIFHATK